MSGEGDGGDGAGCGDRRGGSVRMKHWEKSQVQTAITIGMNGMQ